MNMQKVNQMNMNQINMNHMNMSQQSMNHSLNQQNMNMQNMNQQNRNHQNMNMQNMNGEQEARSGKEEVLARWGRLLKELGAITARGYHCLLLGDRGLGAPERPGGQGGGRAVHSSRPGHREGVLSGFVALLHTPGSTSKDSVDRQGKEADCS